MTTVLPLPVAILRATRGRPSLCRTLYSSTRRRKSALPFDPRPSAR